MNQNPKRPTFFIIGAAKAGTTSLYGILKQHPQVYLPFDKEPAYFCDDEYFERGDEWYLSNFFEQAGQQPMRGEATSRYLYFAGKVAPRIYHFCQPETPRFIAAFRDPASLVYSFYWNSVREGRETLSFKAALLAEHSRMEQQQTQLEARGQILFAYSKIAQYAQQSSKYLAIFPQKHFLFLLTEDLADFPALVVRLQNFLELDDYTHTIKPARSNMAAMPRSRRLHQWLRDRSTMKDFFKHILPYSIRHRLKISVLEKNLRDFKPPEMDPELANSIRRQYSEETKRLQDMIQRDLSKWLPG